MVYVTLGGHGWCKVPLSFECMCCEFPLFGYVHDVNNWTDTFCTAGLESPWILFIREAFDSCHHLFLTVLSRVSHWYMLELLYIKQCTGTLFVLIVFNQDPFVEVSFPKIEVSCLIYCLGAQVFFLYPHTIGRPCKSQYNSECMAFV